MSAHLPECIHPQRDYPCSWCQEIDCECPCVCDRLRSCEQRVRDEILTAAYESAPAQVRQDEVARLYNIGFADALDAARERIMRLPYEIDEEILVDRDEVIGWIDALREEQK